MDRHAQLRRLLDEVETDITVHACRPIARARMKEVRAALRGLRAPDAPMDEAWLALWRVTDELDRALGREDGLTAQRALSDLLDSLALLGAFGGGAAGASSAAGVSPL